MTSSTLTRYRQLSYGLFIHMGLYSLLGGIYQGQTAPFYSEWIRLTLNIPDEAYRALVNDYRPEAFKPAEICRQAKAWGMKYVCFTAKHHDGFAMFESRVDSFNSVHHLGRDFVRELAEACRAEGLLFGLYYSQAQDWDHPGGLRAYQTAPAPEQYQDYLHNKALPQLEELLTQYGPIDLLWLDTPTGMPKADCQTIARLIRRLQPDCLIGGRIGYGLGDIIITGDNRLPRLALDKAWELPATLNSSWGYRFGDENWRSPQDVIRQLTTVVSRGGNLLLNIGPDGAGNIPDGSLRTLNRVGEYLSDKQEAFYTAQATPDYPYEQSDFILTSAPGQLFIHLQRIPQNQRIELYHLENQVVSARLLGKNQPVEVYVGRDLEGYAYWRIDVSSLEPQDIIAVRLQEETVMVADF